MRKELFPLVLATIALCSGCMSYYRTPFLPYTGGTFNQTSFPTDLSFENDLKTDRTGSSRSIWVFWLISAGDSSVAAAAKNGGIDIVDHVDSRYTNVLFIFQQVETIVYGTALEED